MCLFFDNHIGTVHPHGRGEHESTLDSRHPISRFIPTGVGNTSLAVPETGTAAVHPHGRGEHDESSLYQTTMGGSSPRAWGTPLFRQVQGSSPRAWGTLAPTMAAISFERFIPTGVGNTAGQGFRIASQFGSSPRAWGTHLREDVHTKNHRFIPTGVGNTSVSQSNTPALPVHPHGRGEHLSSRIIVSPCSGSSPRAWGTQNGIREKVVARRFIPTGVGNTMFARKVRQVTAVHPHGRGEHWS